MCEHSPFFAIGCVLLRCVLADIKVSGGASLAARKTGCVCRIKHHLSDETCNFGSEIDGWAVPDQAFVVLLRLAGTEFDDVPRSDDISHFVPT
jgi:hypothetical protein